ncbi:MAG TPA: hypothetical protein VJS64_16105 [Pyrinomonadaceae bacterium]|nr:hypothetical protein [Pyrinomonadaceae bacterium]
MRTMLVEDVELPKSIPNYLDERRIAINDLADALHADFVADGIGAIAAKKVNGNAILLGEAFPHLIAECTNLNEFDRRRLAAAWLAVYGYISLLDRELDKAGNLSPRSAISASALLSYGLSILGEVVAGSVYAATYRDNINRAFAAQYADLSYRHDRLIDRSHYDIDKNRAIVAVVAAYSAAGGETEPRLVRITEALLGSFQTLDDLRDLAEDLEEGNLTEFVRIVLEKNVDQAHGDVQDAYRSLLRSKKVFAPLKRASAAISEALRQCDRRSDGALIAYFSALQRNLTTLRRSISRYQRAPHSVSEPELFKRITLVAHAS